MAIKYYYNPSPPSRSVSMIIKYLGKEKDFEYKEMDVYGKWETQTSEFKKINPQHCLPTIVEDDGFVLWESRAILKYLAVKYQSDLIPKDAKQAAIVDRLLFFDMGTLFPAISEFYMPQLLFQLPADDEKRKKLKDALIYLDGFLAGHSYVAGDKLSIADFSLMANISLMLGMSRGTGTEWDLGETNNVYEWFERMKSELPYEVIQEAEEKVKKFMSDPEKLKQFTERLKNPQK